MRSTLLGLLLAASLGTAGAQEPARDARDETAPLFTPDSDVASRLGALAGHPEGVRVPPAESVSVGDRRIPEGTRVAGSVATADGDLHIFGEVGGDALALDGDIVVHEGGRVRGHALAVSGRVRLEGGRVDGEMRMLSSLPTPAVARAAAPSPSERTWRALSIAFGWLVMLALLGMGVLVLAGSYLDGVTETLSTRFATSFWTGLVGQLALLPALLVLSLALFLTVIGILLIPFAVVAFVLAVCGLLALGFLAVALVTGRALLRERGTGLAAQRTARLRSMLVGLVLFLGLWILAASFTWHPVAGMAMRTIAVAVSWVAATLGFGATLLSRGGARRPRTLTAVAAAADAMAWQTPTPVTRDRRRPAADAGAAAHGVDAMRRRPRCAGVLLAAASLGACDLPPRSASAGEQSWRTLEVARQLADSASMRVRVDYRAGQLDVHRSDAALLYDLSLRYDESRTEPLHRLDTAGRVLELGVRTRDDRGANASEMRLGLTGLAPLDLSFELGAVEADLDLGGLAIENLVVRSGASDARLRFEEPNRIPMRRLAVNVGAASLRATRLANANAAELAVGAGVGGVELDFSGEWTRDLAATVDITLGEVSVHVPSHVGVRLEIDRVLASLDTRGLVKREDAYYSTNWETARHHLRLDVSTVVGQFSLDRTTP